MNADAALIWFSSSTYAAGYSELQQFLVWTLVIFLPVSAYLLNKLNILFLSEQTAGVMGRLKLAAAVIGSLYFFRLNKK